MKSLRVKVLSVLFFSILCGYAFITLSYSPTILEDTRDEFVHNLSVFQKDVDELTTRAELFKEGRASLQSMQEGIIKARLSFKRIEFLAEYYDPETTKRYINGAPLPKIEPNIPKVEVIEPNGLQTLDELLFGDEIDAEHIYSLADRLDKSTHDYLAYLGNIQMEHRHLFEASRYQVLRVFTLGVTGFDCPGSVNCLEESMSSLQPLIHLFQRYENFGLNPNSERTRLDILALLHGAYNYLRDNNDFDSFDRMAFYQEYVRPLYAMIYKLQSSYQIEFVEEADPTNKSINYHSLELFSDSLLNPSYYAKVAESDLFNPDIRKLGKILFYDPVLSRDLSMSCATCHHPDKAFTDGMPKSRSNKDGVTTLRNAPSLINAVYADRYFWDMREYDLERQVKHVVYDHKEFNMDFVELSDRLLQSPEYKELFLEAYQDRDKYVISTWSISNALAAYVTSLASWNSPFDEYMRGEIESIDPSVINGFNLFMGKAACGTCHFAPSFNGNVPPYFKETESEVLGVTQRFDTLNPALDLDPGRMANGLPREEAPHYLHSFKTVSVRNVEYTAPYMHNGAFQTLEEVLHFYNQGGGAGMGIEIEHQTLPADHLNLSSQEMADIIHFMKALTDTLGPKHIPTSFPKFNEPYEKWNERSVTF